MSNFLNSNPEYRELAHSIRSAGSKIEIILRALGESKRLEEFGKSKEEALYDMQKSLDGMSKDWKELVKLIMKREV